MDYAMKNSEKKNEGIDQQEKNDLGTILILGGTGKTGKRVAQRLIDQGYSIRIGSRSIEPFFDWNDKSSWEPVLEGVTRVYLTYYPDLAVPEALEVIRPFSELAAKKGINRIVLLSGRGEEEAERCEKAVQNCGTDWVILRSSWFAQNFSEYFLLDYVRSGTISLPAGDVKEPFIDVEDIADVAVMSLTHKKHIGKIYELSGPRALSFSEVAEELSRVSGRDIRYKNISIEQFIKDLQLQQLSEEMISLMVYLFTEVLDGRNSHVATGVQQALGRTARDFSEYSRKAAATGVWDVER